MYKLLLFLWRDLLQTKPSMGFICFTPRSDIVCVPPVYSILSFLGDPTLGFRLVLLFERDHPGKGHVAAVWIHLWSFSVSPSGVRAPHLFDAFELLLGSNRCRAAPWHTSFCCLDQQGRFLHQSGTLAPKAAFLILMKQTNEKNLYIFLVFYLLMLFFPLRPVEGFL